MDHQDNLWFMCMLQYISYICLLFYYYVRDVLDNVVSELFLG